jgi:SAM-dependent methyltransferase
LAPLEKTPFHPQWFVLRNEQEKLAQAGLNARGYVLDIGAGKQEIRHYLPAYCHYFSLDYYQTATEWYHSIPQVFGDGQALPIRANSIDTVLLLDVLEHLPTPEACVKEVQRVLRPGGKFILQVPFLYPLHDAPYDYQRWTCFGLRRLAQKYRFQIEMETSLGHPLESAALLTNLALSKTILNWVRQKHPLMLLSLLLPWAMLWVNVFAWLLAQLSEQEDFMPSGYRTVWVKVA